MSDIDLSSMTLFIRLPNKGNEERFAWIHEKSVRYIKAWLQERSSFADHDYLFHNDDGNPLLVPTLHAEFCRTLCKFHARKVRNPDGFDKWSTHRLRHTMASNLVSAGASVSTIMKAGGWKSFSALSHYAKAELAAQRRGYDEAMSKVRALGNAASITKKLTFAELRVELDL